MSHPSLFPTTRTSPDASRLTQFARRLNGLIELYLTGRLDGGEFASLLNDLGITERTRAYLLRMPVTKQDELHHEYEVCPGCLQVDGNHTEECMG